jgi:hypothetical protein
MRHSIDLLREAILSLEFGANSTELEELLSRRFDPKHGDWRNPSNGIKEMRQLVVVECAYKNLFADTFYPESIWRDFQCTCRKRIVQDVETLVREQLQEDRTSGRPAYQASDVGPLAAMITNLFSEGACQCAGLSRDKLIAKEQVTSRAKACLYNHALVEFSGGATRWNEFSRNAVLGHYGMLRANIEGKNR